MIYVICFRKVTVYPDCQFSERICSRGAVTTSIQAGLTVLVPSLLPDATLRFLLKDTLD